MDFGSLLYKAQRNEQNSKQNSGWYKTTFAPPKKEQREKKLSLNIQKFLAKKEEEEKRKRLEAEKKKQELLLLRNKDKKSFKRVQMMLTKTKSANKSVMEDAVDNVNTAVTANGPLQPDEDDYGYVSKDASELYDKLISKYSSMPSDEPAFSKSSTKVSKDILTTKDRVKAALQREEEEKFLPRKRKRKSKTDGVEEDDKSDEEKPEEKRDDAKSQNKPEKFKIPKKNVPQPPPIDFQSLLKLAEKKQHEPIMIETKVVEKPERPMTQKEKIEYMREKERRMRKEMGISESAHRANELLKKKGIKTKSEAIEKSTSSASKPAPAERLKSNTNSSLSLNGSMKKTQASDAPPQKLKTASSSIKKSKIDDVKGSISKEQKTSTNAEKPAPAIGVLSERQKMILAHKRNSELETKRMAELEARKREAKLNRINQSEELPRERLSNLSNHTPLKNSKSELPRSKIERLAAISPPRSKDVSSAKTTEFKKPISSVQSRQFPPPDVRPKQFPPPDVKRKQFPPPDVIRKPAKPVVRRKVIESDDEYDSEMDDFIDDSEDPTDISSIISDIFKYDRRKYAARDYEDDDECMESNFSQLQKEEFISTKYGILEDLEDVRRTKMEKMRKKKRVM